MRCGIFLQRLRCYPTSTPVVPTITTIVQSDGTFTYVAIGVTMVATIVMVAVIRSKQM
ncbi:MAG: hypothetical protein M1503_01285 [Thaumarchaeota archaeon]|nr:hypothetical protein [Nitrososphaerota archaeon]MCL5316888.1 hypothetical protein [Nitrososphaerota archaeon]